MLLKEHISQYQHGTDEWKAQRIAKITASKANLICKPKGISISYIRDKVGEFFTGISSEKEIDNDATKHGNAYEPDALRKFADVKNITYLVTQKLITEPGSNFSCTPDGIWIQSPEPTGKGYNVRTVEIKCFPTFSHHIQMAQCKLPEQVEKEDDQVFYQVIFQMVECDCLIGYAVFYHPDFPPSSALRIIEFNQLTDTFVRGKVKLLKERKVEALKMFNAIKEDMLNIKN